MSPDIRFREYACLCMKWADEASTEEDRLALLALARDWAIAALIEKKERAPARKVPARSERPLLLR